MGSTKPVSDLIASQLQHRQLLGNYGVKTKWQLEKLLQIPKPVRVL
jgi:hypothetical protein